MGQGQSRWQEIVQWEFGAGLKRDYCFSPALFTDQHPGRVVAMARGMVSPSFARPQLSACKQGLETFWHYKVAPVAAASFDCGNCFQFTLSR